MHKALLLPLPLLHVTEKVTPHYLVIISTTAENSEVKFFYSNDTYIVKD